MVLIYDDIPFAKYGEEESCGWVSLAGPGIDVRARKVVWRVSFFWPAKDNNSPEKNANPEGKVVHHFLDTAEEVVDMLESLSVGSSWFPYRWADPVKGEYVLAEVRLFCASSGS